jgi:hypothetical protein
MVVIFPSLSEADVALLVCGQPATSLELAILTSRAAVCHQHSDPTLVGVGMQLKPDQSRSRIGFVVVERLSQEGPAEKCGVILDLRRPAASSRENSGAGVS